MMNRILGILIHLYGYLPYVPPWLVYTRDFRILPIRIESTITVNINPDNAINAFLRSWYFPMHGVLSATTIVPNIETHNKIMKLITI